MCTSLALPLYACVQVVINPSDDAYFNVISSMSNVEDLRLVDVRAMVR